MGIQKFKPKTPGLRFKQISDFEDLTNSFKRSFAIGTSSMGRSAIAAPSNSIAEAVVGLILLELAFFGT